jgi:ABC-2 type transport system permease protein
MVVWALIVGGFPTVVYLVFEHAYSERSRSALADSVSTATGVWAIYGRPFDLTTSQGFTAWRVGSMLAVAVGLICSFTVVRHSRGEEESGRAEMLLAGSVARSGMLAAAGLTAMVGAVSTGLVTGVGLWLAGAPVAGSLLLGASLAVTGGVFAAAAALVSQLGTFARTANIVGGLLVGSAYVVRAVGDGNAGSRWLAWASPFGWQELTEPLAGNRATVLLLPVVTAAVLAGAALALARARDVGRGLVSFEHARQRSDTVSSPWGLAAHVQRAAAGAWTVGAVVCGVVFGAITGSIVSILRADASAAETVRRMGGTSSVAFAYAGEMLTLISLAAAACGIQGMLHLRSEEAVGRLGWVVATDGRRRRWGVSHLAVALLGSAAVVVAGAGGFAATAAASTSEAPSWQVVLRGALARVPAAWLVVTAAFVVVAGAPRLGGLVWAGLVTCVVLTMFGESLRLADWVLAISPFDHVPALAEGPMEMSWPLVQLGLAAAALGVAMLDRRDLVAG